MASTFAGPCVIKDVQLQSSNNMNDIDMFKYIIYIEGQRRPRQRGPAQLAVIHCLTVYQGYCRACPTMTHSAATLAASSCARKVRAHEALMADSLLHGRRLLSNTATLWSAKPRTCALQRGPAAHRASSLSAAARLSLPVGDPPFSTKQLSPCRQRKSPPPPPHSTPKHSQKAAQNRVARGGGESTGGSPS